MSNREDMDVHWHNITDAADFDRYLGPGTFETETVVTVVCGAVSGESRPHRVTRRGRRDRHDVRGARRRAR